MSSLLANFFRNIFSFFSAEGLFTPLSKIKQKGNPKCKRVAAYNIKEVYLQKIPKLKIDFFAFCRHF